MIANCDEKIINKVIELGAENGILKVSTLEVASQCGINEATIFVHFKNKNNLLLQSFLSIDKKLAAEFSNLEHENTVVDMVKNMWFCYMNYLIAHPFEAKFYYSYRNSVLYTPETHLEQDNSYTILLSLIESLNNVSVVYKQFSYEVIWTYIINNSLSFAIMIAQNQINDDDKTKDEIFALLFGGILSKLIG